MKILLPSAFLASLLVSALLLPSSITAYNVLIIGGTRFSGASLWRELYDRGHAVTLYNRGKTAPMPVVRELSLEFDARTQAATYLKGDRQDPEQIRRLIDPRQYDYVYDMNAREASEVQPLAELFVGSARLQQYVLMSSAGVYLKSEEMPHLERDPVDPQSRHKGKLDSEDLLRQLNVPWCSFRPTYICGPGNYNPIERYFFERIDAGRPICIPGHGQHLTGFGHVSDLAVAMANVIDRTDRTTGNVYNCQNTQAITFNGVAKTAAKVMGKHPDEVEIVHYHPKEFTFPKGKKAFPMRPQHFFCGIQQAMNDLDWQPEFDSAEAILHDAYEKDYVYVKANGGLKNDFECDDIILEKVRGVATA